SLRLLPPTVSSPLGLSVPAPAPTALYTLSLHDALPISTGLAARATHAGRARGAIAATAGAARPAGTPHCLCAAGAGSSGSSGNRSEEHTSELQSLAYLVCRLLLEKKKQERTKQQTIDTR